MTDTPHPDVPRVCRHGHAYAGCLTCLQADAAELTRLRSLLSSLQWVRDPRAPHLDYCPVCGRLRVDRKGHKEGCELAGAIEGEKGEISSP